MPRLAPMLIAFALTATCTPAFAAAADGLDPIRAAAKREGLALAAMRREAGERLIVECSGLLEREAFLRRASLVAYTAFGRQGPGVREVVFAHQHGGVRQTCRISAHDLRAYVDDKISKVEYHRRLDYQRADLAAMAARGPRLAPPVIEDGAAAQRRTWVPVPPTLPVLPTAALEAPVARKGPSLPVVNPPSLPGTAPTAAATEGMSPVFSTLPAMPRLPALDGEWGFGYGVGLDRGAYDAYQLEYAHALLPTLELRPALWILSAFSPLNRAGAAGGATEGLSGSLDLMATSRRQAGPGAIALEGGMGLRTATLQGAGAGTWPAMHLRLGARWQLLTLGMRYPLLARPGDPTGTWEASAGLAWSLGGPAAR